MSAFSLNPVLVKELRQLVRGRFIASVLLLFLAIQLCVIGSYVVTDPSLAVRGAGRGAQPVFQVLLAVLKMACYLCIPLYVAVRLAQERTGTDADLLFVTTLRPGAIVRGKLYSGLVTTALLFSAVMPYMTFIYLLRGLDLPTVFISLGSVFLWSAVLVQLGIFVGALPAGKTIRAVVASTLGLWFLWGWGFRVMRGWATFGFPGSSLPSVMSIELLFGLLASFACFHAFSVALLSPRSANRALPVRATVTAVWILGVGLGMSMYPRTFGRNILGMVSILGLIAGTIGILIAVSERDTLNPRIRRSIPANHLPRLIAFPFFSGAANGILWGATLMLATVPSCLAVYARSSDAIVAYFTLFLYFFSYALTAVLIRRWLLGEWVSYRHTGLIALLMMGAGAALPLLLDILVRGLPPGLYSAPVWHLGNVTRVFFFSRHGGYVMDHTIFALGWAAIVLILNRPWLADQIRAFRPPDA